MGFTPQQMRGQPGFIKHNFSYVTSSADGTKLAAAVKNGGIYTAKIRPNLSASNSTTAAQSFVVSRHLANLSGYGYRNTAFILSMAKKRNKLMMALSWRLGTTNLMLLNVSQSDTANYDVVITNGSGSVTSSLATVTVTILPAKATPIVVNGFIVGATILDGGCGYTNPPAIDFSGQGGDGATAYAQIDNGTVTNVVITSTGSGYRTDATAFALSPALSGFEHRPNSDQHAVSSRNPGRHQWIYCWGNCYRFGEWLHKQSHRFIQRCQRTWGRGILTDQQRVGDKHFHYPYGFGI